MKGAQLEEVARVKIDPPAPAFVPAFPQIRESARRRSRRQRKLARFLFCEAIALALFLLSLIANVFARSAAEAITTPLLYLTVFASASLAVIPLLFFALPDRHAQFRRSR